MKGQGRREGGQQRGRGGGGGRNHRRSKKSNTAGVSSSVGLDESVEQVQRRAHAAVRGEHDGDLKLLMNMIRDVDDGDDPCDPVQQPSSKTGQKQDAVSAAKVQSKKWRGLSLLHGACICGDDKSAGLLLLNGWSANEPCNAPALYTPLHLALMAFEAMPRRSQDTLAVM
jgi:hypothetical protein